MTLTPQRNIADFTLTQYAITCTKVVTNGNSVTITMTWRDGAYSIQSTITPIIAVHTGINAVATAVASSLLFKFYNSPGHLGEYQLNIAVPTTANDKIAIYVDFGNSHVHEVFVEC